MTDIGKSYSLTEASHKHTGDADLNKNLFEIELKHFKPDLIFTFGSHVKAHVDAIIKDCNYCLGVASKYFPHPASRVPRNYPERYNACLEEYQKTKTNLAIAREVFALPGEPIAFQRNQG